MQEAVNRECLAARDGVAILDASTLGKIDIQGRDAAEFLDRIYTGGFRRLRIGRCRYGLMLHEDGTIFDDGVTARIGERRYLVHTTTGNAEAVLDWLELWRQTEWPDLDVYCTSVTDHWATLIDAGGEFGITPYGTETMHVLRAEKGFIIVGQDTDASMTPADMGMDWAVRRNKPFGFLGDRSLSLADHLREDRLQLVGLASGDSVLPEGAALVETAHDAPRGTSRPGAAYRRRSPRRPPSSPRTPTDPST